MIHSAAVWDLLGAAGVLPQWWPPVSYVLAAAGIAAACVAVLIGMFSAPRGTRRTAGAIGPLAAAGILLAAWLLRGHAEIPPDPPIVAAQAVAAILYALAAVRRKRQ